MHHKHIFVGLGLILGSISFSTTGATFAIDAFQVDRNGSTIFFDHFADGLSPPLAPNFANGAAATYTLMGNFAGSEANSRVTLDPSLNGVERPAINGGTVMVQRAMLNTNIDPNSSAGLKLGQSFRVGGLFDLIAPTVSREAYTVRLEDFTATGGGNDVLEIGVFRDIAGQTLIQFRDLDFLGNTITILGAHVLTASEMLSPQIAFGLETVDAVNDPTRVRAGYAFYDGANFSPTVYFGSTGTIFSDEVFTRPTFLSQTPSIPLPATWSLLAVGLIGWRAVGRRKST